MSEWYESNPFNPVQASPSLSTTIAESFSEEEIMGFLLIGPVKYEFFSVTCPCGVTDVYPLNGFPEVDTLHSCGKPNHWFVKYQE